MNECTTCVYANAWGEWPHKILRKGGTHCMNCHRTWFSKSQSHCTVCHRHFGSDSAGDNHRFGDYRSNKRPVCRDPQGFDRWETPSGIIWGGRDPVAGAERMAEIRASTHLAYEESGPQPGAVEDSA